MAEHLPLLREAQQEFQKALLSSPFRPDFEAEYGGLFLRNMELELKTFIPAIVPLMQRENALTLDYGKLIASAQIPFEGGVYTLSQLTPFKQDPDDARRRAAWEAEGRFYLEHGEELDASMTSWSRSAPARPGRWAMTTTWSWATTAWAATATPRRTWRSSAPRW